MSANLLVQVRHLQAVPVQVQAVYPVLRVVVPHPVPRPAHGLVRRGARPVPLPHPVLRDPVLPLLHLPAHRVAVRRPVRPAAHPVRALRRLHAPGTVRESCSSSWIGDCGSVKKARNSKAPTPTNSTGS